MTMSRGPSAGPRRLRNPIARHARASSAGPSRRNRPSGGFASSEIVAPHQLPERLRQPDSAVLRLVILEQRHKDARRGERGVVEGVDEADLALFVAPPEVRPPSL